MMRDLTLDALQRVSSRFGGHAMAIHEPALMEHAYRAAARSFGGLGVASAPPLSIENNVALIRVEGMMVPRAEWFGEASTELIAEAFAIAEANADVARGVVLIDTPGGTTHGHADLMAAAASFAKSKPLVAQVSSMCCSAGYWLATAAEKVYANAGDIVGSIGVRNHLYDFSKMFEEMGVETIDVATGPYKSMGLMGTPVTDEQRSRIKEQVDYSFDLFSSATRTGRSLTDAEFQAVATGAVWFGEQAVGLKLVDALQPLQTTLAGDGSASTSTTRRTAVSQTANAPEAPQKSMAEMIADQRESISRACPGAPEEFINARLDKTPEQASREWMEQLAADREAADQRAAEAEKRAEQANTTTGATVGKKAGNAPVDAASDEEASEAIDYLQMAKQLAKEEGILVREASRKIMKRHPDAHAQLSNSNARDRHAKRASSK